MLRRRARVSGGVLILAMTIAAGVLFRATPAPAHSSARAPAHSSARAPAPSSARPRIGHGFGIQPVAGSPAAPGTGVPIAYHGGPVMRDVTIHAVFWAPPGYRFSGSPAPGVPGYQALQQQFLADVAHDSGSTANVFSVLGQYGDGAGVGRYQIRFDPLLDTVDDTHPYPPTARQCPSPAGTASCLSDAALQAELDRVIGTRDRAARGLSNVWLIFLPPDVDTCLTLGSCATSAYAGYHSLFDRGHGVTVYSPIPDPLVELTPPPGADPAGNPEAEQAIDTVAHEVVEAITDPKGTGWMDPNGFEAGDKCENGPQQGAPLGYAPNGAPYNQVIGGHRYLLQYMWSNRRGGCVAGSAAMGSTPGLHTVLLRQFSAELSGRAGQRGGLYVAVALTRAGRLVAVARTRTRAGGAWGPVRLRDRRGRPHAVGDDRDVIAVVYGPGRSAPRPDLISTGDGGNPFTQAGYTGWYDLDHGNAIVSAGPRASSVLVGPCAQTGILILRVGSRRPQSPTDLCQNALDAGVLRTGRIGGATNVTLSSEDNRGESFLSPTGTLVRLTVALGEPDSVAVLSDGPLGYPAGGFPACTAYLRIRTISCAGLVPGGRYRLARGGRRLAGARAGSAGRITISGLAMRGGDVVTLINSAGRRLTSLHVARLRVDIAGNQTVVASGACQPGEYWGPPPAAVPPSRAVGSGLGGSGEICPSSGRARGLPTADVVQTDEFSGGQTVTQVPTIRSTAPIQDETLYGAFIASAQSGLPGPHGAVAATGVPIALTIRRSDGSRRAVFHAANVDTAAGVPVPALAVGTYVAAWVLHDAAGDTRTVTTRFTEA